MERKIYYSPIERAFLFSDVHGPASLPSARANPRYPSDAVEVSEAHYTALMAAQAAPNWSTIEPGAEGVPQAVPASDERVGMFLRMERDARLAASDVLMLPDRWGGYSENEQAAITSYREALRDLPAQPGWPRNITWPELPQ